MRERERVGEGEWDVALHVTKGEPARKDRKSILFMRSLQFTHTSGACRSSVCYHGNTCTVHLCYKEFTRLIITHYLFENNGITVDQWDSSNTIM